MVLQKVTFVRGFLLQSGFMVLVPVVWLFDVAVVWPWLFVEGGSLGGVCQGPVRGGQLGTGFFRVC